MIIRTSKISINKEIWITSILSNWKMMKLNFQTSYTKKMWSKRKNKCQEMQSFLHMLISFLKSMCKCLKYSSRNCFLMNIMIRLSKIKSMKISHNINEFWERILSDASFKICYFSLIIIIISKLQQNTILIIAYKSLVESSNEVICST